MTARTAPMLGPPYVIRTPRLLLRCLEPADAERRMEAMESSGEHLADFLPPVVEGQTPLEAHAARVRRSRGSLDLDEDRAWAVCDPATGRFLGETGLLKRAGLGALEVFYWLRRDATGRGLATEMASAVTRVAFELDRVHRVDLYCRPENVASAKVARRLGFSFEGRLRDRQLAPHHERCDLLYFTMLAGEFPASAAAKVAIEAFDFLGRPLRAR